MPHPIPQTLYTNAHSDEQWPDAKCITMVMDAALTGDISLLHYALSTHHIWNQRGIDGLTPEQVAYDKNHTEIFVVLLGLREKLEMDRELAAGFSSTSRRL